MIKKQNGFTLIELLITMAVFLLVIAASSSIFTGTLTQFKQQRKIAESNIEGMVGLEIMRRDIEQAGFGLPWDMNSVAYSEAVDDSATIGFDASAYNDSVANLPPRAVVFGGGTGADDGLGYNIYAGNIGSDVLVIKSTSAALNDAGHKWTYITNEGLSNTVPKEWVDENSNPLPDENLVDNQDQVIVMALVLDDRQKVLISDTDFHTTFQDTVTGAGCFDNNMQPVLNSFNTFVIYGVSTSGNLRMPFNRADYYVRRPAATNMPDRCAPDTGILYKGTINHDGGSAGSYSELPILDCVADMQAVIMIDDDGDPTNDNVVHTLAGKDAEVIREQVREVRVYILTHEGQRDPTYTSPSPIVATDPDVGDVISFMPVGNDQTQYRWRIYQFSTKVYNLRS